MYILDFSDPTRPDKISEKIHTRDAVQDLYYDHTSRYLYIASGRGGLEIWDIVIPSNPARLGYYFTPGESYGLHISGHYAYIADGDSGLRIIDVSNPTSPAEVGHCGIPGYSRGIHGSGAYAHVAAEKSGIHIVDITSPTNPAEVDYYQTSNNTRNLFVSGDYIYAAADGIGLEIYNFYGTAENEGESSRIARIQLLHNPVRKTIVLLLDGKFKRPLRLNLYNTIGQRIRTYHFEKFSHRLTLPPSGVYFLEVERELDLRPIKVVVIG